MLLVGFEYKKPTNIIFMKKYVLVGSISELKDYIPDSIQEVRITDLISINNYTLKQTVIFENGSGSKPRSKPEE